jgi:hypothetical protein
MHNQEMRILQYVMRDRLRDLDKHDTEAIDGDLGRSAAGAVTRTGFERMVAEVLSWEGRSGGSPESLARPQQSRLAAAHRDVPPDR